MTRLFHKNPLEARERAARLAFIAASVLFVGLVQAGVLPECAFRALTGHDCPTCGVTRSWQALAGGDLEAAFGYHPLGPGLILALVVVNALFLTEIVKGRRLKPTIARWKSPSQYQDRQ